MKKTILSICAIVAGILPAMANAEGYSKSIVEDLRGNPVTTLYGVCVTHDFPEGGSGLCNGRSFADDITIIDQVAIPNVVYFDFARSSLNSKGKKVVSEVAKGIKQLGNYSITLSGHTDTVDSAAFNKRLSAKRAQSVKNALVASGVSASKIKTEAMGESENAVPTADGVPEALNRRVEISVTR